MHVFTSFDRKKRKVYECPLIYRRMFDLFANIRDRISSRLAGWKTKFLSLAGRQALVKFVLNTIPLYAIAH